MAVSLSFCGGATSTLGSVDRELCDGTTGALFGNGVGPEARSLLSRSLVLHAQDALAHFAAAIIDNGRLPIGVALAQFFEKTSGKAILGQRRLELIFVLQFLALLRGHVGLEKNFARIVGLRGQAGRSKGEPKNRRGKSNRFSSCEHEAKR